MHICLLLVWKFPCLLAFNSIITITLFSHVHIEFQGYQQHDSSELMNFLLDGLHEDLNRVLEKPYTEAVENDGTKPDDEMARIFLEQHMKRNDSYIHDLFRGQFKSTLVCPSCGNVSVTFDPYTMVSLPLTTLSQERMSHFKVILWRIPQDGYGRSRSVLKVSIPKGAKGGVLTSAVAEAAKLDVDRVVVCQLMKNYVYKVFDEDASLDYIGSGPNLVAYEVNHMHICRMYAIC
jgi:hypothetical protein